MVQLVKITTSSFRKTAHWPLSFTTCPSHRLYLGTACVITLFQLTQSGEMSLQSDMICCYGGSRNSSVTTVIRTGVRRCETRWKARANESLHKRSILLWRPTSLLFSGHPSVPGIQRSGRQDDCLCPSSADIKNWWGYKFTSHMCLYVEYIETFTLPKLRLIN